MGRIAERYDRVRAGQGEDDIALRTNIPLPLAYPGHQLPDVAGAAVRLDLPRIEAGGIQRAFNEAGKPTDRFARSTCTLDDFIPGEPVGAAQQALQGGVDDGEGRAELVGNHRREVAVEIRRGTLARQGLIEFGGSGRD